MELTQMLLLNLALPVIVALIISILTSHFYQVFREGERKSDAIHSSIQLWIGSISRSELINLCSNKQAHHNYLLSIILKESKPGEYTLSILPLDTVNGEDLIYSTYKVLRLTNIGQCGAVLRYIIRHSGNNEPPFVMERKEQYLIESNISISLYMNELECPDEIVLDYPKYQLTFDNINAFEPYVRIPKVKKYKPIHKYKKGMKI